MLKLLFVKKVSLQTMVFDLIKIGYISKPYAFKGELRCTLDIELINTSFPEYIWMYLDGKPVPFKVNKASYNKQSFVVKLEDIDSEESAMRHKNTSIFCETNLFDNFFETIASLDDLVGFRVTDSNKGEIGIVHSIIDNAIQPTLVLSFQDTEILVPYNEDIIQEINDIEKTILVTTPKGLIDLYLE